MQRRISLFVWASASAVLFGMPTLPSRSAENGPALAPGGSGAKVPESASAEVAAQVAQDQEALSELQPLIGGWKGVGQPRRGSAQGAWSEEAEWAWDFDQGRAAVAFTATGSRYFAAGRIVPGTEPGELVLYVRLPAADGSENNLLGNDAQSDPDEGAEESSQAQGEQGPLVVYRGRSIEGRWEFTCDEVGPSTGHNPQKIAAAVAAAPARVTLRLVAEGKRLVVLLERRLGESEQFARLAEIGYTRKGSGFGQGGGAGPECIVTGGLGTIAVEYKGKTYYVCCTGCRDYFVEHPEEVLAQYRQRIERQSESP